MTWEAVGVISSVLVIFGTLMAFIFQTKSGCGQCQSRCRGEVFANTNQSAKTLAELNAKLDMLLLGLNIKVEAKKNE